jgi:peptide/nickel transport system substrate-binding protein
MAPNAGGVDTLAGRLREAGGAGPAARTRLYGEIERQIIGQAYAVPLYVASYRLAATRNLRGISWATNAKPNLYDVSLGP